MPISAQREKVYFISGGTRCAAWHYPGTNGACVIMAGGLAVTKEAATDLFAQRFHDAGFSVLAFDYRRLGESDGHPRLVLPIRDQLADWQAAIGFAKTLPAVNPGRVAVWAFSASGGHVLHLAARNSGIAAAIAQTPYVGGLNSTLNASRYQKPLAQLRFTGRGIFDALGGLLGRRPRLVALTGAPGNVAMLTTPDSADGDSALQAHRYPDWKRTVAARSALGMVFYRPGREARRVRCPLLVLVCEDDRTTPAALTVRAVRRTASAEIVRIPGGHYGPFLGGHARAAEAELSFLRRQLLGDRTPSGFAA